MRVGWGEEELFFFNQGQHLVLLLADGVHIAYFQLSSTFTCYALILNYSNPYN